MLVIESPSVVRINGLEDKYAQLKAELTFVDQAAKYEYKRFQHARWFVNQYGQEAFVAKLAELKALVNRCLLFEDERGYWTYSGLAGRLSHVFKVPVENRVVYPEYGTVPYDKTPTKSQRPYQIEAKKALLEVKHGGVEIGTGLGKSFIIEHLTKTIGLKTIIMAPSRSIASQLYKQLQLAFGKKRVGLYGDGRKDFKKLFTVGISASLTRIEKDSDAWKELSKAQQFIADESHLCPADTLASVCFGLCADAPYRFFFSGTQLRADGAGMLLDAITGPIVFRMTVKEGVDQGYLAKPNFMVATVDSPSQYMSDDHMDMMNVHYYRNPTLAKHAANITNKSIELLGHQVLILVEHVDQLQYLLPYFKHEVGFAHGGLTKDNKDSVDPRFHLSDPDALVTRFNAGELPILVGTSCISTGTDIQTPKTVIYLQGGQSEVKIRQAIGRGTRLVPGKNGFNFIDYDVNLPGLMSGARQLPSIKRHAQTRREIYDSVYGPVKEI